MENKMNEAELTAILNIGKADENTYENFAEQLLSLDKRTITEVCIETDRREEYGKGDFKTKEKFHSSSLIDSIQSIYNSLNDFTNSSINLAISLHSLREITQATYKEIASMISRSYQRKISTSYLCKLIKAGGLLKEIPELKRICDIEKLAILSSYDLKSLKRKIEIGENTILFDDINLETSSRSALNKKIKPNSKPRIQSRSEMSSESHNVESNLNEVVKANYTEQPSIEIIVEEENRFDSLKLVLENYLETAKDFPELFQGLSKCIELISIKGGSHE